MLKKKMTIIIYLIGKPGTGKYTIAQELAKHGYRICDNQLVNNPIFSLLNYDGFTPIPMFAWNAISHIRNSVFDFIISETNNNYVFTNVLLEDEGDRKLFAQVEQVAIKRNSIFVPIKLLISEKENIKRIKNKDRLLRYKSIDVKDVYLDLMRISHDNLLELDVSDLSARTTSEKILLHVKNIVN